MIVYECIWLYIVVYGLMYTIVFSYQERRNREGMQTQLAGSNCIYVWVELAMIPEYPWFCFL